MPYQVTLELDGGRRLVYVVKATGGTSAAHRARGELARQYPRDAYTAIVVDVKPAPEPDPG
jgi:hypothetical protein